MSRPSHRPPSLYRARQLVWHLRFNRRQTAPPWLQPAEAALFSGMAPADQREGLAVAETLRHWGFGSDRDLLVAAVLHDAGKSGANPAAVFRVAITVLETLCPPVLRLLARHSHTFGVLANHASLGAKMAAEAGLNADVQRIIGLHHDRTDDPRIQALQRADALH